MDTHWIIAGVFLLAVVPAFASVIGTGAALYRLRRNPPLAETLARDYATKSELDTLAARIAADLAAIRREHIAAISEFRIETRQTDGEIFNVVRRLTDSTNKSFRDVEASLGRIEGSLNTHMQKGSGT